MNAKDAVMLRLKRSALALVISGIGLTGCTLPKYPIYKPAATTPPAQITGSSATAGTVATPPASAAQPTASPAQPGPAIATPPRPAELCPANPGTPFAHKKKLALLSLNLPSPRDAQDLPGISAAWSLALQSKLRQTDRFLLIDASTHTLDPGTPDTAQILGLAARTGAQFVVTGTITDLSIERNRIKLGGLFEIPRGDGDRRRLAATLRVYDGFSGNVMQRIDLHAEFSGEVMNPSHPTLSGRFFETNLGAAFARLLNDQASALEDTLACLPMMARVLRGQRNEVVIDAGFSSGLQPGDRLKVFQRASSPTLPGTTIHTATESKVAELALERVLPETSIGRIDSGITPDWVFGGFVRSW